MAARSDRAGDASASLRRRRPSSLRLPEEGHDPPEPTRGAEYPVDHVLVPLVQPVFVDLSLSQVEETDRASLQRLDRHPDLIADEDGGVLLACHDVEHLADEDAVLDELRELRV